MGKQEDGRYRGKVTVDGKAIYVSAKTKRELEEKKRYVREHYICGVKPREAAFIEIVQEWFETFKRPRIKANSTLQNYENAINLHIIPYFHANQMIKAVRRTDLQSCLDHMTGMSYIMPVLVLSIFRHTFKYAITEGMVLSDPTIALVMPEVSEQKEKDALTREQETALLEAAERDRFGMMIYLLYYLGLRRGEMLGLRWGDIDWTGKMVHVQRDIDFNTGKSSQSVVGELKTKAANRYVPIPDILLEKLRKLRSLPNLYIISENGKDPLNQNLYRTRWNRMMRDAGQVSISQRYIDKCERWRKSGKKIVSPNISYDYDVHVTPHWFRHHYITAKVEAGERPEIIMAIVGHRSYNTTINIYTHIKDTRKDAPRTLLAEIFTDELEKQTAL